MGGEGIEVEVEAVTGEDRQTARRQGQCEAVHEGMGQVLRARAEGQGRDHLGLHVQGQPQP